MRLLCADSMLDKTSRGSSQAPLLHELVLPSATCTSVLAAAMRLLRAEGTYDDASTGSQSRVLPSHVLALPAAACMSSFEAAMRSTACQGTLDDASSGSSRASLSHSLARPASACAQLAAHACFRDFEAAIRLQSAEGTLDDASSMGLRVLLLRLLALPAFTCAQLVGHARSIDFGAAKLAACRWYALRRKQRQLVCFAFTRACAFGCGVHEQLGGGDAPAAC